MARIYLNDVCNASAAAVAFIMLCSRFIDDASCQEFILKFITICLNQYLQYSIPDSEAATPSQGPSPLASKGKMLALPAPEQNHGRSRDFRISSSKKSVNKQQIEFRVQKQEQDLEVKLKKNLIISILLKLQNLKQQEINDALKDMVLGAQKQFRDQNKGYLSNGLMTILKFYGDPDSLFNQFANRQKRPNNAAFRAASDE